MRLWVAIACLTTLSLGAVSCSESHYPVEEPVRSDLAAEPADSGQKRGLDNEVGGDKAVEPRKVFHDGSIKLEAKAPAAAVDAIATTVKQAGGYVEEQTSSSAILRVPVDRFQACFDATLKLGKVISKNISTQDITEAYADVDLRKRLIEASLRKFEQLLSKASTATEKLALLKEIGGLREKLEQIDSQLKALANLAKFSRLTVDVVAASSAQARVQSVPIGAFLWMQHLSPDDSTVVSSGKRIELPVPNDFVAVSGKAYWLAESASQASVRAARRPNNPRGSNQFWSEAIRRQLEERFAVRGVETRGSFTIVRTRDDSASFSYDVAVTANGDVLDIVEMYYPTEDDEKRFASSVLESLASYKGDKL